jgi:hypothetical protein
MALPRMGLGRPQSALIGNPLLGNARNVAYDFDQAYSGMDFHKHDV